LKATLNRVLKRALAESRYVPATVRLVWAATARWTALWLALLFVQGLLPAAAVYLTKGVVDGLLAAIASGTGVAAAAALVKPAALLASVMVLQVLAGGAIGWVRFLQSELLQDYISRKIHEKSVSVKMPFYDFPEYYDHLHRARDEAAHRPAALLEVTGGLLQNAVTAAGVAVVLLPYGVWLPAALFVGSLPSLWLVLQSSLRRQAWIRASTPQMRKVWYLEYLVTAREVAAEIRIFNLGGRFIDAYQTLRSSLRREQSALVRREGLAELFAALLGMTVAAGAGGWVVWQAMQGRMTAGALAMFFVAFTQSQALVRSLLQNAGQMYSNSLFLGNLFQFLALESEAPGADAALKAPRYTTGVSNPADVALKGPRYITETAQRLRRGIRFEEVDFTYPGASARALAKFTLDVPAGRTVAIVGPNGAGKSTIIKLLCRFYEPDHGRIWIDGADIRERPAADIRRLTSVLFQDPVRYAATVTDNVAPGSPPPEASAIEAAVRAAGAERIVERLPRGYDTLLGKWFDDGVELSGGEWQRIALARAFLRDAPILLLDEPTSAMDSWAEADWFDRFRPAAAGRTTIIITHRFTTAMQADVIHVLEDGRSVESGSHQQLLDLGGRYAYSWARQTQGGFARESDLAPFSDPTF
jgi:ATP-binding cassette subfamily B protein